jgi:hypothetical protein
MSAKQREQTAVPATPMTASAPVADISRRDSTQSSSSMAELLLLLPPRLQSRGNQPPTNFPEPSKVTAWIIIGAEVERSTHVDERMRPQTK